jgi:hypothetical protein
MVCCGGLDHFENPEGQGIGDPRREIYPENSWVQKVRTGAYWWIKSPQNHHNNVYRHWNIMHGVITNGISEP